MEMLFVSEPLGGGVFYVLFKLLKSNLKKGHKVYLVGSETKANLEGLKDIALLKKKYPKNFFYFKSPFKGVLGKLSFIFASLFFYIAKRPKISHGHGPLGLCVRLFFGSKRIFTYHGAYEMSRLKPFLYKMFRFVDIISSSLSTNVAVSSPEYRKLKKARVKNLVLIKNGIKAIDLNWNRDRAEDTIRFIIFSRLSDVKIPLLAISEVDKYTLTRNKRFVLDIYGDGPLLGSCRELASKVNSNLSVNLNGYVDSLGVVEQPDVCLFFSKLEGLSISLLELLATNKPVVVSLFRGHSEFSEIKMHGVFWFDERNSSSIQNALHEAVLFSRNSNIADRKRLIESHYSDTQMINGYDEAYFDL